MAKFEPLRITTPTAALAGRDYPGQGEPVVLLHGGPGMGDYFGTLPELLSPPYRVISYDQRGCGASRANGSFTIADQVSDVDAIRRYSGAARIHLFGHSWGGLLGQLYAKAHADHVASLVLCCSMANTGAKVAAMESKGIAQRVIARPKRSQVGWLAGGLLLQLPGKLGDLGFGMIMRQLMPNYVVRPEHTPRTFEVTRASKHAWRETNRAVKDIADGYIESLSLDAPVLILQGEQDVIRETNAVLAQRFPSARNVRIPEAAHFPWLEQPEAFADALLSFYRSVMVTVG